MRGRRVLLCAMGALLAVGGGTWIALDRRAAPRPAAPLTVEKPRISLSETSLEGRLRAQHVINVEASVNGIIEAFDADVGQEVHEGELLVRVSSQGLDVERQHAMEAEQSARAKVNSLGAAVSAARMEASRARADASRARRDSERTSRVFERQRLLHREGATPRLTFERAEREFENSQNDYRALDDVARRSEDRVAELVKERDLAERVADDKAKQLEEALVNLAASQIRAPADGIVVGRQGEAGRPIDPVNRTLFQIAIDPALLEAVLDPEPPLLPRFRPGQPALIVSADLTGDEIPGQVRVVQNNHVVVEFVSPTPLLRPGMSVRVRVRLD